MKCKLLSYVSILFFVFCHSLNSQAQSGQTGDGMAKTEYLPASPNAASLGKYGDIPISYNTGVPNISIPIYELKECDITLPVSLSYHAGGIRVQEEASMVGLGWSLNAGGAINRITRGMPDEGWQGFFTTHETIKRLINNTISGNDAKEKKVMIMNGSLDSEPDLFSCNVGGISIKFSMDLDGNFVTFPTSNYKILYDNTFGNEGWTITDDKGNEYYFGRKSNNISLIEKNVKTSSTEYPSAWFINKIVPFACNAIPNTITPERAIRFTYQSNRETSFVSYIEDDYRSVSTLTCSIGAALNSPSQIQPSASILQTVYLTKVEWSTGEINFTLEKNRSDNNSLYKLNSLVVMSGLSVAASCSFVYSFNGRMTLNSLTIGPSFAFNDYTGEIIKPQQYFFEYNPDLSADPNSRAQDHWGYYNGGNSTQSLIPSFKIYVSNLGGVQTYTKSSNRAIDPVFAKSACIKKIIFPTGGSTEFEFESNTQRNYDMNKTLINQPRDAKGDFYSGGLRIAKTTTHDPFHPLKDKITTYRYEEADGHSSGYIEDMPIYAFVQDRLVLNTITVGGTHATTACEDVDYVVMKQTSQYNLVNRNNTTYYSRVTVLQGANGIDGKDEYVYNAAVPFATAMQLDLPFAAIWSQDWKKNLLSEIHYKWNGSGFDKVEETSYGYSATRFNNTVKGYKVGILKLVQYYSEDIFSYEDPNAHEHIAVTEDLFSDYSYLNSKITKLYASSDPSRFTTTQEFYEIDPVSLYNRSTKIINSLGQEEVVTRKYSTDYTTDTQPQNFDPYGSGVYYQEYPKVYGLLVEEFKTVNGKVTDGSITLYNHVLPKPAASFRFESRLAVPKTGMYVESYFERGYLIIDPHYKQKIEYTSYDEDGNVRVQKVKDGAAVAVLWDYNNQLPVAEAKIGNAVRDVNVQIGYVNGFPRTILITPNFAATSFEGTNFGGWQGVNTSGIQNAGFAPTGLKAYNLASGALTFQFVRAANYYLYVWVNGTAPSVSLSLIPGSNSTPELVITGQGGWQLYRYRVNSSQVNISGNCLIDELRIFPEDMRLTTTTYFPGIGVQTICDADGNIVRYKYDALRRLTAVIDIKGNIIKTIDYQVQK